MDFLSGFLVSDLCACRSSAFPVRAVDTSSDLGDKETSVDTTNRSTAWQPGGEPLTKRLNGSSWKPVPGSMTHNLSVESRFSNRFDCVLNYYM